MQGILAFSSSEIDLGFDFTLAFAFGGNFGAGTPGVSAFGGAGGAAKPLDQQGKDSLEALEDAGWHQPLQQLLLGSSLKVQDSRAWIAPLRLHDPAQARLESLLVELELDSLMSSIYLSNFLTR